MKNIWFGLSLFFITYFCYADTPPDMILSNGKLSRGIFVNYIFENNNELNRGWVENIIDLYIYEANIEGVNYEIAIAQMIFHTRFLSFLGTRVTRDSNNFCGLSTTNDITKIYFFDTYQIGIRAHIQHLKGYATREPLINECVDPRYSKIEEEFGWGSSPTIDSLAFKWANNSFFVQAIKNILLEVYMRI